MKNKRYKAVCLTLCLSLTTLFGCANNSSEGSNSDTNVENTESVESNEDSASAVEDNDVVEEDNSNVSEPIVMKVSEAFDLQEKRVWYQVFDYPTAYDSTVRAVFVVENGYADGYVLNIDNPYEEMTMEDFDGLTIDEIEQKLASNLLYEHEKITYEYSRDDTGNNVEREYVNFSSKRDQRINFFASEPITILSKEYIGFGDSDGGEYVITEDNFGAQVQFVYNDITNENMEEY